MFVVLTETIQLQVDSNVAKIYNDASPTDREKLQALFGSWMKHYAEADAQSLKQTMDEMAQTAGERGLTPELLEELLTK